MIDFLSPGLSLSSPLPVSLPVADDREFLLAGPNSAGTQPPLHTGTFAKFPKQSPTADPAIDTALGDDDDDDDGEIMLVGPNYAGTRPIGDGSFGEFPINDGTFGDYPKQPPTTPASVLTFDDDGEILLVGPSSTETWNFLDGGNFGEFPSEIGLRSTRNPFLADILASSSGVQDTGALVSNGAVSHMAESPRSRDHDEGIGPDTGTGSAFRRSSPFTGGRGLSRPVGRTKARYVTRWSPGSAEVTTAPLSSFHPKESTSSQSQGVSVPPVMLSIPPTAPRAPALGSPVLCETNLDESLSSTSPVAFVVS